MINLLVKIYRWLVGDDLVKYGGAVTGWRELWAIFRSALKSTFTRNWQEAEEGKKLSKEAAEFLGVEYGILTNSGSSAGLLALSALELPKGSEVIISAVTFPTIFNIILQCNLVPVVIDAKVGTYAFDIGDVEKAITEKTKAIIAIHPLGNPVDMLRLMELVKKYEHERKQKIYVLEDNCDGWGSTINNQPVGSFGDVSITSFHAAHIVSMGVGGGVFTRNRDIAQKVRMYRDWGRQADINKSENTKHPSLPEDYNPRFIYEVPGYNFQILELQAAMGRVQLRKTAKVKKARKKNFEYLTNNLSRFSDLILPYSLPEADVCWFSYPITTKGERGPLLRYLEAKGIETRPLFSGDITRHPAYQPDQYRINGELKGVSVIVSNSFWLSCHPSLSKSDLKYIIKAFEDYYAKN